MATFRADLPMESIFAELSLDNIDELSDDSPNEFLEGSLDDHLNPNSIFTPSPRTPASAAGRRSRGHRRASSDPETLRRFAAAAPQSGIVLAPPPPPVSPTSALPPAPLRTSGASMPPRKVGSASGPSPNGVMLRSFVAELDDCMGSLGSPNDAFMVEAVGNFGGLGVDLYPALSSSSGTDSDSSTGSSSSSDSAGASASGAEERKKRKRNRRTSTPHGAASATHGKPKSSKGKPKSSRGRYKCGRCGQVKHGHKCLAAPDTKSLSTQCDLAITRGASGSVPAPAYRTLTVSSRTSISEPMPNPFAQRRLSWAATSTPQMRSVLDEIQQRAVPMALA